MRLDNLLFKKILIIFWFLWWLIALWTDIVGALAHLGMLHASWAPDTNYPFLVSTLKMYHVSSIVPLAAFIGILLWSTICTGAFLWAVIGLRSNKEIWFTRMRTAFIISLSYWLAFFLADQWVMKFDLEENHMVQGGFELLTFLAMYLLPDSDYSKDPIKRN